MNHGRKRRSPDAVEAFKARCRRAGLRVTHQRIEIFRELTRADDHPSAEEVHRRVRERLPVVSLDTVYRTLAAFERHGLVRKLPADGAGRFDGRPDDHAHVVCRACGNVSDLPWPAAARLRLPPGARRWGRIEARHVQLVGVCNDCLRKRRHRR